MSRQSRNFSVYAAGAAFALFLVGPLIVVGLMSLNPSSLLQLTPHQFSLHWYEVYFADPAWQLATWTSVKIALAVAALSTFIGLLTALGLLQMGPTTRAALEALVYAPLIAPTIVLAVGLYMLFAVAKINGTIAALLIGHCVLAFPYAVIVVKAGLEDLDPSFERAALSLGASRLRTFFRVTLPLVKYSLLTSCLFCFLISFDEVVLTIFLSGPETITLSRKMWDGIRFELSPAVAAVSTLLILVTATSTAAVGILQFTKRRAVRRWTGAKP